MMYEEEKRGSGAFIKDLIIKLLYMLLFLFLFMWLYPAPKVDLSDVKVKVDKSELKPLFAGIFNDNITAMKEAARSYYTTDRLPSTNGGKAKMTLQEMLNKKMIAPFVDSNGKSCDTSASYVEVTRNSAYDYNMKVYLACSDKKDYIIETIGCTSICPGCVNTPTVVSAATNSTKVTKTGGYGSGSSNNTIVRPSTTQTVVNENKEYVTVYFDAKGGSSVNSQTVLKGNTVYSPTTTRSNYTFLCWSTNSNDTSCSNAYNFNTPVTHSRTLYAQWASNETKLYEYVKSVDEWETNNTWTTTRKSTSDTVKLVDTRTRTERDEERKSYTYRTVSWIFAQDSGESYSLYLNNIPSDATDVRITSQSKFSSYNELRNYVNNRYSCNIQMVGYGCPSRSAESDIQNREIYNTPVASFSYNTLRVTRQNGRWVVPVTYRNNNVRSGDWTQYIAPIKFTVQWYEEETERVKEYKYAYKTTTKDYKYSTNKNDTSLLNSGYTLTGNTK